jgi:hypothetical protein
VKKGENLYLSFLQLLHQPCSYVAELLKMRETFINPLLHPHVNSSPFILVERDNMSQVETLVDSLENLPIASRFLPPPAAGSDDSGDNNDDAGTTSHASHQEGQANLESVLEGDPREPLDSRTPRNSFVTIFLSRLSLRRSRTRPTCNTTPTSSLGRKHSVELSSAVKDQDRDRMSTSTDPTIPGMQQKCKETFTKTDVTANGGVSPHQLPDDLRQCLEGIEGILGNHLKLIKVLRKRYNEQYPLVRSLADVFVDNVRSLILLFCCPDHRFTLALVTHLPRLCGLCRASRTGPRPS